MAICSVTVVPVGTGDTSVSAYVARCHEVLAGEEGIGYRLTPMATIIEGDLQRLFEVIARLHRVPFDEGARRVLTTVMIDDRVDKAITMDGKIESVRARLDG